jgi:hypothetical protein
MLHGVSQYDCSVLRPQTEFFSDTHLHMTQILNYVIMALGFDKHTDNFTFTLY